MARKGFVDPKGLERMKKIARMIRIAGYITSLAFLAASIYWIAVVPGGWFVGIVLLIPAIVIIIESRRVSKI